MTELQAKGYNAVINRGCITSKTTPQEFIDKLKEELLEVLTAFENNDFDNLVEEIADLRHTCDNFHIYLNLDPEKELKKVVLKNERRANEKIEI